MTLGSLKNWWSSFIIIIILNGRYSTTDGVDKAKLELFAKKQRPYDAIPPVRAALIQHSAAYQAGCTWAQAILHQPDEANTADWAWEKIDKEKNVSRQLTLQ